MYRGWYQVAFERELERELTPIALGSLELVAVTTGGGPALYSAYCPHRGAHLGHGGRLDGDAVVCPFHGRRIGLGEAGDDGFRLRAYRTLAVGGLVFALLDEALDRGFAEHFSALESSHYLVPGFTLRVRTRPELVIENALDQRHFSEVHGLAEIPALEPMESRGGELAVRVRLATPRPNAWQTPDARSVELGLRIFSPNLCVTEIGGEPLPTYVITAATPEPDGECRIRVSVAVPPGADGGNPDLEPVRTLLRDSRTAIEQDAEVWRHLAPGGAPVRPDRMVPGDELVARYYAFCREFDRAQPAS
jgi:nitrite reductase/ring-hydroxylating ferredoxin subunit